MKEVTLEEVRQKHLAYKEFQQMVNRLDKKDRPPLTAHLAMLLQDWQTAVSQYNAFVDLLKGKNSN